MENNNAQILADSLHISVFSLNHTKRSLQLLNKRFMRIVHPEEKDNNILFKALIYYLARTLKQELNGEINISEEDGIVSSIIVTDKQGHKFNADIDLPEIWAEGPQVPIETNEEKKESYLNYGKLV